MCGSWPSDTARLGHPVTRRRLQVLLVGVDRSSPLEAHSRCPEWAWFVSVSWPILGTFHGRIVHASLLW